MKAEVHKVKYALAPTDLVDFLAHFLIRDNWLYASNGRFTAVAPIQDPRTYLVPGMAFQLAVDNAPGEVEIDVKENRIVVKSGKYRATILTLGPEKFTLPKPSPDWRPIPELFLSGLRRVRPFVSVNADRPWSMAIGIDKGHLYACNNNALVVTEVPGLDDVDILLPGFAADYLLRRQEPLIGMNLDAKNATFQFADGSWMRAQLTIDEFPPGIKDLLEQSSEPSWEVPDELRAACARGLALIDNKIRVDGTNSYDGNLKLAGDMVHGGRGKTKFEQELMIRVPVPNGGESMFHPRFLNQVLQVATHWSPEVYPRPTPFKGERLRGLLIGRH